MCIVYNDISNKIVTYLDHKFQQSLNFSTCLDTTLLSYAWLMTIIWWSEVSRSWVMMNLISIVVM
jgi:hypothetical protein